MARQQSIFKIQGLLGDFSFYKTVTDGFLVRRKSGIDARRVKTDPRFARTRENSEEFATAVRATKLFRTAFRNVILNSKDNRMSSRLTGALVKAIRADKTNARGKRTVANGDAQLVRGFEINNGAKLGKTFLATYSPIIDRATGVSQIAFGAYAPSEMILAPSGATHCRLIAAAALLDFKNETYNSSFIHSGEIPLSKEPTLPTNLCTNVLATGAGQIFQILGIEFLQYVNGNYYVMNNGTCNGLAIVGIC